ncbi:hypothetical protein CBL_10398 [Carabus blaptoides fortunei]
MTDKHNHPQRNSRGIKRNKVNNKYWVSLKCSQMHWLTLSLNKDESYVLQEVILQLLLTSN